MTHLRGPRHQKFASVVPKISPLLHRLSLSSAFPILCTSGRYDAHFGWFLIKKTHSKFPPPIYFQGGTTPLRPALCAMRPAPMTHRHFPAFYTSLHEKKRSSPQEKERFLCVCYTAFSAAWSYTSGLTQSVSSSPRTARKTFLIISSTFISTTS